MSTASITRSHDCRHRRNLRVPFACAQHEAVGLHRRPADRRALLFRSQKISLHHSGKEFSLKGAAPLPGSADVCFIATARPDDVVALLKSCEVDILERPVKRAGAVGFIMFVCFRDPDGNLVQVSPDAER